MAAIDVRVRLLGTAFAWLEGLDAVIDGRPPFDGTWTCCHRAGMSAPGCHRSTPIYHELDPAGWCDYDQAGTL